MAFWDLPRPSGTFRLLRLDREASFFLWEHSRFLSMVFVKLLTRLSEIKKKPEHLYTRYMILTFTDMHFFTYYISVNEFTEKSLLTFIGQMACFCSSLTTEASSFLGIAWYWSLSSLVYGRKTRCTARVPGPEGRLPLTSGILWVMDPEDLGSPPVYIW